MQSTSSKTIRSPRRPKWTRRGIVGLLSLAALALATPALAFAPPEGAPPKDSPEFPRWVMEYQDDLHRGDQSHSIMEMTVQTKHWTRKMAMESWSKGKDYSLVRILAPKKERGTATLKADDDLFTYLGKTGRTIKITGAMMGGAWMGSHLTNDDLVKSSRFSEDYDIKLTYDGEAAGVPIYQFTLTPKPDAAVVWGQIKVNVRQADLQPINELFYDEDGKKVREMAFSNYETMGGRLMPTRFTVTPLDKPGEFTRIDFKKLDFDVSLDRNFFSLQKLKAM
jgi:outer membrane lipoprotein-sorting protein